MLPSDLYGPTTETVGYFELPATAMADALHAAFGDVWSRSGPVDAGLADVAAALPHGQGPVDRYAIVDLGDGWCAVLTNGPLGTDVGVLPSWIARTQEAIGIRATAVGDHASAGREGGTILEVYDPAVVDSDPLACRRTLSAVNDGGSWSVEETGEPFDFETPGAELDADLLRSYLAALGVPSWSGDASAVIYLHRD